MLTMLAARLGSSMVRPWATCAGCPAQATGSDRSRAYIIAREPTSAPQIVHLRAGRRSPWSGLGSRKL